MSFIAGLAGGFADGFKMQKDRKRQESADAMSDRYLSMMEKTAGIMPLGGRGIDGGPGTQGGTGAPGAPGGGAPGGDGSLFGLVDKVEGGGNYDTLYGHSQNGGKFDGVKVSEMTLGDLYSFADPNGEYGQWVKANNPKGVVATPMGRHQIVGTTLKATAAAMGLSPDTKFTAQTQDAMANYLARNRIAGLSGMPAKRAALRSEWDGFRNVSDDALDAAILNFEAGGMGARPMGIGPS